MSIRDEENARLADALRGLGLDVASKPGWQERVWRAIAADQGSWQYVNTASLSRVRRHPVPGGWLYQVELALFDEAPGDGVSRYTSGWHGPVFVPDPGARP